MQAVSGICWGIVAVARLRTEVPARLKMRLCMTKKEKLTHVPGLCPKVNCLEQEHVA